MPKHVKARAVQDKQEEPMGRKLAKSHHAPADWKFHAQMVISSWASKTPNEIAAELGCHPQTVRIHLARFNAEGVAGLGMRAGSGRKARLTEQERSRILALVKQAPPGHLETQADGTMVARDEQGSAQWTLNALAQGAKTAVIGVTPIGGVPVQVWTRVRNPNGGRLPLHRAARGVDDHLHRRDFSQ